MICVRCNKRVCKTGDVCEACRTKDWRKRNPKRVKAYAKMRMVRATHKITWKDISVMSCEGCSKKATGKVSSLNLNKTEVGEDI
jgi:hypothetical protein